MPRIEHIAFWVDDLDALSAFYAQAFGAQVGPRYVNAAKGWDWESDRDHRLRRYERGDAPVLRAKKREK